MIGALRGFQSELASVTSSLSHLGIRNKRGDRGEPATEALRETRKSADAEAILAASVVKWSRGVTLQRKGRLAKNERGLGWAVAARRVRKRHKRAWLKWAAGAVLLAFLLLGIAITVAIRRAEPILRAAIVEGLEEHFHAHVELDSFRVSLIERRMGRGQGTAHLAAGKAGWSELKWRGSDQAAHPAG